MMRLLHFLWFLYIHGGDAFATSSLRISYSSLGVSTTIGNSDFVEDGVFMELIRSATNTLTSSDTSENEIEHSYGSASQGQWICNRAAANMQTNFLEGLVLKQVCQRHVSVLIYYNTTWLLFIDVLACFLP